MKVFYPPLPSPAFTYRGYALPLEGLEQHPRVELVDSAGAADVVVFESPHMNRVHVDLLRESPAPVAVVDWQDRARSYCTDPARTLVYFKRSVVAAGALVPLPEKVVPISYAVMDGMICKKNLKRDIDLGCFFSRGMRPRMAKREKVLAAVESMTLPRGAALHTGIVGAQGNLGRSVFHPEYLAMLRRCRVVVTANPDAWEGDSRTWEALANGPLVVVNKMLTPVENPLVDREHVVFYDPQNMVELKRLILYYLRNEDERARIALQGQRFALARHRARNRGQQIYAEIKRRLQLS